MSEYQFIRHGTFLGGPYDGAKMSGHSLPDSIKIEADDMWILIRKDPDEERRRNAARALQKQGSYLAGDEYVCIDGEMVDFCSLLEEANHGGGLDLPDEVIEQCDWVEGAEDDDRVILISIQYVWQPNSS